MTDLFHSYWWLIFPVGYMLIAAYQSLLGYWRQKEMLRLIRTYAEKGQEPPEALLKALEKPAPDTDAAWGDASDGRSDGGVFMIVLFACLAGGFGYASYANLFGVGEAFMIVAFVMGALALASLLSALVKTLRR